MADHRTLSNSFGNGGESNRKNRNDLAAAGAGSDELAAALKIDAEIQSDLATSRQSPPDAMHAGGKLGAAAKTRPPMVQSQLLGSHVHETVCGTKVAIWQR